MLRRVITIMTDTLIHLYTGDTQEGGEESEEGYLWNICDGTYLRKTISHLFTVLIS